MAITYLKKSPKTSSTDDTKTTGIVQDLLKDLETSKEQGCIDLTKKFDKYDGEIVVQKKELKKLKKL
jgi:sulfopropanediol 3-dehydrogenase